VAKVVDAAGPDVDAGGLPADVSAAADGGAGQNGQASDGGLQTDVSADVSAVTASCVPCPQGQKCRPDTGVCVAAGVVACAPACPLALVCRLEPPPACVVPTCKLPNAFSADVLKLTALSLQPTANPCPGGQNALGKLAAQLPMVKKLLDDAVANDQTTVLLENAGVQAKASEGALRWLFGTRDATSLKCDTTSDEAFCGYTASQTCWDRTTPGAGACKPWMSLPVKWTPPTMPGGQGQLATAAQLPPGDLLQFAVPLTGGAQVLLQIHHPRLQAQVSTAAEGEPAGPAGWRKIAGTLCGAVPVADLDAALAGLPKDTLDALGGLQAAQKLRAQLLPADVDLDGDNVPDAASAAIGLTGTRAKLTGLSPLTP
jgi:hypothetical protein